ncbi:CYTH domain-containing protein [Acerihabitans arboris]|uniref:CYTH domain-containing protein n=1 Tax=Acerihabitans arboris TaxID=2691583 RepID=A0A845SR38_9GAMM|nr:inorganic triphosphatase [Acerihabitans arboris]NDL63605.1 CYTH domain-containing protein [Acerihabitans arboris]
MSEEIEIKFIVHPDAVSSMSARVSARGGIYSEAQRLINSYFDTAGLDLRLHGVGLRVRGHNERYEMTAKTAGKIVGGLHQHPEYTIPLPGPELDIALLPADIWPAGMDAATLQARLEPLFRTDYLREKWVVTHGESEIEVAFDQGEVAAGDVSEAICELEMELLRGHVADLLAFARSFSAEGGLRQGSLSKAARGYHLAAGNEPREIRALPLLRPAPRATVEQGLSEALSLALAHWQYHEELWLARIPSARESILSAIMLIRETFVVMGNMIPRKATNLLRAQMAEVTDLLQSPDSDAQGLCYEAAYLQCKLALTSWLILSGWQGSIDDKARRKLDGSFKRFADIMLSRCAAELKVAFGRVMSREEYQQHLPRLERRIMAFHLLSGAYPVKKVLSYILHWQALQQAIMLPGTNDVEVMRRQALAQTGFWLSVSNR